MLIQHFIIFSFSLSVLVHAIGDASEITQNSTDKKLRMVEKETDCRLKHLQVNVERLKSILLTSDLGRLSRINGGASFRWSFGPLSAWGGIESTIILTAIYILNHF